MTQKKQNHEKKLIKWLVEPLFQGIFSVITLALILVFLAGFFLFVPNDGLATTYAEGGRLLVVKVEGSAREAGFQPGDKILKIEGRSVFFQRGPVYNLGLGKGDKVTYEVERAGQILTLTSEMDSPVESPGTFGPMYVAHFMAIVFWAIGVVLCLFSARDDLPARLIGLCWLLAGVAAAAGGAGVVSHFWGAAESSDIGLSLLGFMLLTAHLHFPRESFTRALRTRAMGILAAIALTITVIRVFESIYRPELRLASDLATWLFLISVFGSIALLVKNRFDADAPDARRQTGIILSATILSFGPLVVFTLLPNLILGQVYVESSYTFLFLLLLPLAYGYTIHQRTLLKIDLMINRIVVLFVLLLLILFISISILGLIAVVFELSPEMPLWGGVLAALLVLPSAEMQKRVQKSVNRILYGAHYDFSTVTSNLSNHLVRALNRTRLVELLTEHVAEEMGIVQTALILSKGDTLVLQAPKGLGFEVSSQDEACQVLLEKGSPVRSANFWGLVSNETAAPWNRFAWAELFVPLVLEEKLYGILMLGARVASEIFSEQDLRILAVVGQQGALAISNVQLVEEKQDFTQGLVRTNEALRKTWARDLHDAVLQDLSFIMQGMWQLEQPAMVAHLEKVIKTLRRMIKEQRSSLIEQGLAIALKDLVDDMRKLPGDPLPISWEQADEVEDLPLTEEQALTFYRIAQEAISNALKHARASKISVGLRAECLGENGGRTRVRMEIADDGIGIRNGRKRREGHYGIPGMEERANMIGADLEILSIPKEGTTVGLELKL